MTFFNKSKRYGQYKKGQQIIVEGLPVNEIYFIHSGKAKIVSVGPYHRDQILWLAKTGDVLGITGMGGNNTYPSSAFALEDSMVCSIDAEAFTEVMKLNPELTFDIMLFFANEIRNSENRLKKLLQMTVREKVADTLLYIHNKYGCDENGDIGVQLYRQEIAEIAGTTKEQVSKCISEFEDEGILKTVHKAIIISRLDSLKALAGERVTASNGTRQQ